MVDSRAAPWSVPARCLKKADFTDPGLGEFVERFIKTEKQPEKTGRFGVILHNDPLNGMDYVVKVIKSVFGYGAAKAVWLMLKAHFTGKSVLWVGDEAAALQKREEMVAHGPDDRMVEKGARALTVTVEKIA